MGQAPLSKEEVARRFAQASPKEAGVPPGPSDLEWAYREAAAVLTWYETDWLRPARLPSDEDPGAMAQLLADSTAMVGWARRPRWTVRSEVRRETLRRLENRAAMLAALGANPDRPQDAGQHMLELSIRGELPPLEELSVEELEATLQAAHWLSGIVSPVPSPGDVQRRLEWARLIKPFRWLVGDDFCGRDRELAQLREYVGVLPARHAVKALWRGVREFFSLVEQPPLVVHGPGGIGKSTLLARFVLEHLEAGPDRRFPFTYIDFDRSDLTAEEPATLLVEAVRQLGIQFGEVWELCHKVRQYWLEQLARAQAEYRLPSVSQSRETSMRSSLRDRGPLLSDLGKILAQIGMGDRPYLLILDTFEMVQHRSGEWVAALWSLLDELQARFPRLRTVIAGRAPIGAFRTQDLALGDLDRAAAKCLLRTHHVTDPDLVRQLARQVGGNPLSLELAAEVVVREGLGSKGIQDLGSWKRLWLQVQENGIQGYLYRRLLDHIEDGEVRRLAHPGLVLRRITPELIRAVLAEPCGVDVRTDAAAQALFDRLQQEVTLVSLEEDGSLRHRSDVRAIMLEALKQDEPLKVRRIHERAAAYYHGQMGVRARAEEIYHRLFLEKEFAQLDPLWEPEVEAYLQGAIDEVPRSARPYLASHLGVTRDDLSWDRLEIEAWERSAAERVRSLIGYGQWQEALEVLAEREERTEGSRLYLLEAQVLERLGRRAEARRVLKKGLYWAAKGDNPTLLLDLLRLAARLDEQLGQVPQAREVLAQAGALLSGELVPGDIESRDAAVLRLEIALDQLRLARLNPSLEDQQVQALREGAFELFEPVSAILPQVNRPLLRAAAQELGATYPQVLRQALQSGAVGRLPTSQREALGGALAAWDAVASAQKGEESGVLARAVDLEVRGTLEETWSGFVRSVDPTYLSRVLDRLLADYAVPERVVRILVDDLLGSAMLFVDRERELQWFRQMLRPDRAKQVMLVEGDRGIGKSFLLARMGQECKARDTIPHATVDFRNLPQMDGGSDALGVIRLLRDGLGQPDSFGPLSDVIRSLTRTVDQEGSGLDLGGRALAEQQVSKAFFECLRGLAANLKPIVLFFDSCEMLPDALGLWLREGLLGQLATGELPDVVVILAGRALPDLVDPDLGHLVARTVLDPFDQDRVRQLFEAYGLPIDPEELRTLSLVSGGVPGLLVRMVDNMRAGEFAPDSFFDE